MLESLEKTYSNNLILCNMKPSIIIPPSVFYTQLLPFCTNYNDCYQLHIYVNMFYDAVTELIPLFYYGKKRIDNPEYAKMLMNEKLALSLYLQEIGNKMTEMKLKKC